MTRVLLIFALAQAAALSPGAAQVPASVTLNGELADCPDLGTVAVFEPVPGGRLNYFFSDGPNEAVVQKGHFTYALRTAPTGLISLTSKCLSQTLLFVEPGAVVGIRAGAGAAGQPPTLSATGTNAVANGLLLQRRLLNNGPADGRRIASLLAAAPTASGVLASLQTELATCLAPLETAYRHHEISRRCRDYLRAETEQRLLAWAAGALSGHFTDSAKANLHLRLSRAETRRLTQLLFARYNPALPRYQGTTGTGLYLAALRQQGVLPGPVPVRRTWAQYVAQFEPIASHFEINDYLSETMQATEIGDHLLYALAFSAMPPADFAAVFADYVRLFPNSPYNAVVVRGLRAEATRAAAAAVVKAATPAAPANGTLGYYAAPAAALTFGSAPGLDTVQTLAGVVRQHFAGRPVFVDIWASWCGPCIAEFRHEPALYKFLTDNGIDILYVAIDQPGYRDKWAAFAAKNQLRGYHYLASPAVQKVLARTVSFIPRYMLFGKNGALLEADAAHPSSGEKLFGQLRERLKTAP